MQGIDGSQDVHGYRTNRRAAITESEGAAHKHSDVIEAVPLYLVPPAVTASVKKFGGAIREMHVTRGGRHMYGITVVVQE
ncbi:hypothetical protein [Methanofollis ethanolicus]|uniref:hypothetical protein n=1 Tax=Methanofollis ethanolicus TaxID=488124 RepID=UPI00128F3217|nr:hypothetical protein [Methanofollis ethanolicus]